MRINEIRIERRRTGKLEKKERLNSKGIRNGDREEKRIDSIRRKPKVLTSVQGLND
jgi:hypothetical protein